MLKQEEIRLNKQIKKLKGINPDKTEAELRDMAIERIKFEDNVKALDIDTTFTYKAEKDYAKKLAEQYLTDFVLETISDRQLLKQILFLEVTNYNLQKEIQKHSVDFQTVQPDKLETYNENSNQLIKLKTALGITRQKQQETQDEAYVYLDKLKKKYRKWLEDNQISRTFTCPHCVKDTLLLLRMDIWDKLKHPFIKDKILTNFWLMKLFVEKKIDQNDVAKILGTSADYTDWLIKHWQNNPEFKALLSGNDSEKESGS